MSVWFFVLFRFGFGFLVCFGLIFFFFSSPFCLFVPETSSCVVQVDLELFYSNKDDLEL